MANSRPKTSAAAVLDLSAVNREGSTSTTACTTVSGFVMGNPKLREFHFNTNPPNAV